MPCSMPSLVIIGRLRYFAVEAIILSWSSGMSFRSTIFRRRGESRGTMTKCSLSFICLRSFLKSKDTRFLSKMLRASAITIDGIKMMLSPFSHSSNIPAAFLLSLGLSVNHQMRAWVSVTKFIEALYPCFAVKGFLCKGDVFISNIHALQYALEGDCF